MTGAALLKAQLRDCQDLPAIHSVLDSWIKENADAPRVLGIGWLHAALPGGQPTKEMLDALIPDKPAYLDAFDLHSSWLNSAALKEIGVDDSTPDPVGGKIARDADGHATGHLLEMAALNLVWPITGASDDAESDKHLATALKAYNETGVTAAVDMAMNGPALATLLKAENEGTSWRTSEDREQDFDRKGHRGCAKAR